MEIRPLSDRYAVSPQIEPADVPAIAEAGYETVLCNRPDAEIPAELHAEVMRTAVEAAGLRFVELPATHATIGEDLAAAQSEAAEGRTLAYCASGTRSSVLWALDEARRRDPQDVLADAARAGYDLSGLRLRLDEVRRGAADQDGDSASPGS